MDEQKEDPNYSFRTVTVWRLLRRLAAASRRLHQRDLGDDHVVSGEGFARRVDAIGAVSGRFGQ